MTSPEYDYCILGAGIAGLSLADSLQKQGRNVCVLDKNGIASGASGTPYGLINPATGRRATKTWRAEECYSSIIASLKRVAPRSESDFYRINGVLRPALTAKIARKMHEQYKKTHWPDGWCYWLSESEIKQKHPGINCVDGGLWIPVGTTVDVGGYLTALASELESRGVPIVEDAGDYSIDRKSDSWKVILSGRYIESRNLVFATGYGAIKHTWWKELPFHPVKGQLALFKPETPLTFDHSISSLGYIAHLDTEKFAQGSTYEHEFNDLEPDSYGEKYLRNRLKRTLPDLANDSSLIDQWAGVRISTPDRKPVLGVHREIDRLFIFNGLGSKGLMYGKYLADLFARHLAEGEPLLETVAVDRLY